METDTSLATRKYNHLEINLSKEIRSSRTTGLERLIFIHEALPEIALTDVDISTDLFGKKLTAPILISSMTGGTELSKQINARLAQIAQEFNIAMGVGSQRVALENPETSSSFSIMRQYAPNILIFANLGAIQLNYGYTLDHCKKAIDMIAADALVLHLNSLQEAVQENGNTGFRFLSNKIHSICRNLPVPVIVKEVGFGISNQTARILNDCGVAAIDVAGVGGTSWSQVEMYRAVNKPIRDLASSFRDWGITTRDSILNIRNTVPDMKIIASGGLNNGLDVTKCLALGAVLGGMAGQFLQASVVSTERIRELLRLVINQIKVTMFVSGVKSIPLLSPALLVENK